MVVEETDAVSPAVAAALGGAPMLRRLAPRCLVLLAVVVSLLPACTDNADDDAAVNASTTTTTTLPSTTTAVPETTTTTVTEQAESDAGPFPLGEPVDLLIMSDSSGIGVAERYAPLAAEALDREIRVHDWARGGEPITVILDWIQTTLADEVAEAEIIVVYGYPGGLEYNLPEPSLLSCFEALDVFDDDYSGDWTPGTKWEPTPLVPTVEDWQPFRDVLDQVFDEIWTLREGKPTIIRTYDVPLGFVTPWKELGIEPECTANLEIQAQVEREAAEANGAGFVSLFDVFNGPNHDEDPVQKGWMLDDLMHAGEEGLDIVAKTLAAYGFEASEPPR